MKKLDLNIVVAVFRSTKS